MILALATLCYVTAAPIITKFEASPRQFGSGLVVGLKRASNTANQSASVAPRQHQCERGPWCSLNAPSRAVLGF